MHLTVSVTQLDKFQFVEQNSVECWCDFGANLVQHFMQRYSRYSRRFSAVVPNGTHKSNIKTKNDKKSGKNLEKLQKCTMGLAFPVIL